LTLCAVAYCVATILTNRTGRGRPSEGEEGEEPTGGTREV
jgi:hypothetical protein